MPPPAGRAARCRRAGSRCARPGLPLGIVARARALPGPRLRLFGGGSVSPCGWAGPRVRLSRCLRVAPAVRGLLCSVLCLPSAARLAACLRIAPGLPCGPWAGSVCVRLNPADDARITPVVPNVKPFLQKSFRAAKFPRRGKIFFGAEIIRPFARVIPYPRRAGRSSSRAATVARISAEVYSAAGDARRSASKTARRLRGSSRRPASIAGCCSANCTSGHFWGKGEYYIYSPRD